LSNIEHTLWLALAQAISGKKTGLQHFNAETILTAASANGIIPLLEQRVSQGQITGLGEASCAQLKNSAKALASNDLMLNHATRETLNLLGRNNIPALLLKGTPLSLLYYGQSYLRPRCDTDLYISERDLEATARLLSENGYDITGLGHRKLSSKQFGASRSAMQQVRAHFDIHWNLSNRVMFRSTLPFDDCYESRQPLPALGSMAATLCTIDLLLHACIHRIAHGRNTERNRLIWLYDIHLLAEALGDTGLEIFLQKAKQKNVAMLCADALATCRDIFGTAIPENFIARLKAGAGKEPSARLIEASKLRWAWEDMRSLESMAEKIAFARELLSG